MSSLAAISTQPTTDPNIKIYNTRFEMSSGPEVGSRGNCEEVGEFGRLILDILGITQVHICPYVIMITKAPLFDWSEIDPRVEEMLKMFAKSQVQIEDALSAIRSEHRDDQR